MTGAPRTAPPGWVREVVAAVRGEAVPDAPLAPRTSIRVGGPADLLVRPEDVASDNTIPSSAVSDLVINYGGKGDLNDVTKQGWFTKLLHKIWPF